MLLISPRPIVDTLASPNSCRFSFSSTTLQNHQRACTDTAFLARSVSGPLVHARSTSSSFRLASPSPPLHRSNSSILLPVSTKHLKRACPDTPASPTALTAFERQRNKAQRISACLDPGSKDLKAVQTRTTGGAKVDLNGQGGERRGCGAGKKEIDHSSAHRTTIRQGQPGQTKAPQLHRLRLIKGMSTSTAPGRARPRLSLSVDTSSASAAQTPSTGTPAVVSPYNPDPIQDTMSSSPVTFDIPPAVHPSHSPPSCSSTIDSTHSSKSSDNIATHSFAQPTLMKRANAKRLSLSLAIPPTPTSATAPCAWTFTTPAASEAASTATEFTPYTPGPPMTPAMHTSLGRAATKASRRPNLMSLITQPPVGNDVPPTPGAFGSSPFSSLAGSSRVINPYATARDTRRRSNTSEDQASAPAAHPMPMSRSAYPRIGSCDPIVESENCSTPSTSATHSRTDSGVASTSTSMSNPAPSRMTAYASGPVELVPGVYLGAEDSMLEYHTWASTSRVRILNVAQELDDPWMAQQTDRKGKGKAVGAFYPADATMDRPDVLYRHLLWSHGEAGLAEIDETMDLGALINGRMTESELERDSWRFWEAIRWVEEGRRRGERVLIHCQCGISRSATLSVAYLMALAATGALPEQLGHLSGMQDTYAFVKAKSSCIGPNVSLVFQLVEFARNLTTLLERYISANPGAGATLQTSFPKTSSIQQSEAEWARQRAAFDNEEGCEADQEVLLDDINGSCNGSGRVSPASSLPAVQGISIRDMQREAEELDEAMRQRRLRT